MWERGVRVDKYKLNFVRVRWSVFIVNNVWFWVYFEYCGECCFIFLYSFVRIFECFWFVFIYYFCCGEFFFWNEGGKWYVVGFVVFL